MSTVDETETLMIGTAKGLQLKVSSIAEASEANRADIGGELLKQGFEIFETRTFSENTQKLVASFEAHLSMYEDSEKSMWPVRLRRRDVIRLKLSAKEFNVPVSRFAASMIAFTLSQQETVS
jgi:hypothetical protein